MAFKDLTDMQREGISEIWLELRASVKGAEEFEAACKEAGAESFSTAMRSAMLALSSDMRNGYGPAVMSGTAEAYFDENCGESAEEQSEFAKRLADDLIANLAGLQRSLRSARDVLSSKAEELERLADMADTAID